MTKQYEFEEKHVYDEVPKRVFPLLCPVYEADYLDGWEYEMVFSYSGFVELGCVFTTPHHGEEKSIWTVSLHDPKRFIIEFVRVTPNQEVVTIAIYLKRFEGTRSEAIIRYIHTPLTKEREEYLASEHEEVFKADMLYWEMALNHYLKTGDLLKR